MPSSRRTADVQRRHQIALVAPRRTSCPWRRTTSSVPVTTPGHSCTGPRTTAVSTAPDLHSERGGYGREPRIRPPGTPRLPARDRRWLPVVPQRLSTRAASTRALDRSSPVPARKASTASDATDGQATSMRSRPVIRPRSPRHRPPRKLERTGNWTCACSATSNRRAAPCHSRSGDSIHGRSVRARQTAGRYVLLFDHARPPAAMSDSPTSSRLPARVSAGEVGVLSGQ